MPKILFEIDYMVVDEDVFQLQLDTLIERTEMGIVDRTDLEDHWVLVQAAIHSIDLRSEAFYTDSTNEYRPDYSRFIADLDLYRSILEGMWFKGIF